MRRLSATEVSIANDLSFVKFRHFCEIQAHYQMKRRNQMPSKLDFYSQMADHTAKQITGSFGEWTAFLETAGRLYKYPFHEQLMIFAQKPDVIMPTDALGSTLRMCFTSAQIASASTRLLLEAPGVSAPRAIGILTKVNA